MQPRGQKAVGRAESGLQCPKERVLQSDLSYQNRVSPLVWFRRLLLQLCVPAGRLVTASLP